MSVRKIISGGQTGADRGGLDAAFALGIPHGGFVPLGRRAEDGRVPDCYQLEELPAADYLTRTWRNVMEADGTIVFTRGVPTPGSEHTINFAQGVKKPVLHVDLMAAVDSVAIIQDWLAVSEIAVLNVAGSRESRAPGICEDVGFLLFQAIGNLVPAKKTNDFDGAQSSVAVGFDTETCLIRPGLRAPPLVCATFAWPEEPGRGSEEQLLHHTEAKDQVKALLEHDVIVVGHHVAYDMIVISAEWPDLIPAVFRKYERDQVACTEVREKLIHIAGGIYRGYHRDDGSFVPLNYALEDLADRHLGVKLEKEGGWRLRYGELRDVPVTFWPEAAVEYAVKDAVVALEVWKRQEVNRKYLEDEYRQARAQFWLDLMACWGLRTDPESVEAFAEKTQRDYDRLAAELRGVGIMRRDGTRNVSVVRARVRAAYERRGLKPPRTPKGGVKTDADVCEASRDPLLEKYAELSSLRKTISTDIPLLSQGLVQAHFESLVDTGRTASSPNVQNLPTEIGVRECFAPRPGWVFAVGDYAGIELRTWAQVCLKILGHSKLAVALNSGMDPHIEVARRILGISYEEALADYKENPKGRVYFPRQSGKVGNFGFPGGLGVKRFVDYARKSYGVVIEEKKAAELREFWFDAWEGREYFEYIKNLLGNEERPQIKHLFSNRFRGDVSFTEAANSLFQGLAADIAKNAGFLVSRACYAEPESPLYGSRIVNFIHDELLLEVPDDNHASDRAEELGRLMVAGAAPFLPDVPPVVKPLLCRRWSKAAKPVRDVDGQLVPWDFPRAEAAE